MLIAKESAEQAALVARCNKEGIFIVCTENSLNFPTHALLGMLKPMLTPQQFRKASDFIRTLLYQLNSKRLAMGLVAGYPDLFVPQYQLYIEMKRIKGGILSEEQIEVHQQLREMGYTVIVPRGGKEAWEYIQKLALKG